MLPIVASPIDLLNFSTALPASSALLPFCSAANCIVCKNSALTPTLSDKSPMLAPKSITALLALVKAATPKSPINRLFILSANLLAFFSALASPCSTPLASAPIIIFTWSVNAIKSVYLSMQMIKPGKCSRILLSRSRSAVLPGLLFCLCKFRCSY